MRLNACIEKGVADQRATFERVRFYTTHVCRVIELLSPDAGDAADREHDTDSLILEVGHYFFGHTSGHSLYCLFIGRQV